ncbi:MAG: amidase family protein, partial [Mobilicoccus sp.]|nr:amidase family protein [Mobilicoccus sp.]
IRAAPSSIEYSVWQCRWTKLFELDNTTPSGAVRWVGRRRSYGRPPTALAPSGSDPGTPACHAPTVAGRGARSPRFACVACHSEDLVDTAGITSTSSSRTRADHVPAADAAVVERLAAAGAIMVGKTHTHEFAYGVITPTTRNPWNTDHIPGGGE